MAIPIPTRMRKNYDGTFSSNLHGAPLKGHRNSTECFFASLIKLNASWSKIVASKAAALKFDLLE